MSAAKRAVVEAGGIAVIAHALDAFPTCGELVWPALNGVSIRADRTPLANVDGLFELVVANLFAEVLIALSTDLKRVCARRLVVAGVLADRADAVIDAMRPMRVDRREEEGDWCHLGFSR